MTRDATKHQTGPGQTGPVSCPLSLEFDAAEFAHFLSETDWSDEQRAEYVTLVWNIVCEFVALGWGVHPVQQAQDACGKLAECRAESAPSGSEVVQFSHGDLIEKFMRMNGAPPSSSEKGVIDE